MDQDDNQKSDNKRRQSLSIDKAAFLLLRIKRVFKKRSQSQHIEKRDKEGPRGPQPPPLLRSSTLPAIIVPGLNILHAQIGPNSTPNGQTSGPIELYHAVTTMTTVDYGCSLVAYGYFSAECCPNERPLQDTQPTTAVDFGTSF